MLEMYIPYCGTAPIPAQIWARWNLDPVLLMVLAALLVAYHWAVRAEHPSAPTERQRWWFTHGWAALTLGLISPLCNLSIALFSARVTQHMWLALIAAPLLALGGVLHLVHGRRSSALVTKLTHPLTASALFAVNLWVWHLPSAYQATFESHAVYWLMHIALTGSAVLLWHGLLLGDARQIAARMFGGFVSLLQMGILGALITFAPRTLYPVHMPTTEAWGLTALEDQQLGGLIMWIPGCSALAVFLLAMFMQFLQKDPEAQPLAPPRL